MYHHLYTQFVESKTKGQKKFVVLIDPDSIKLGKISKVLDTSILAGVDYFFVGGSLIVNNMLDHVIQTITELCDIPVVLFPGNPYQISSRAHAMLFLSLISGRNPDLLIGNQVISAPLIKSCNIEAISTGYMLIDGGNPTSVQYMSNTTPIPAQKDDIALCTAMAGELLGMKQIFMDAGSGALHPVSASMIHTVSSNIDIPLIVGGGIDTPEKAAISASAGADMIVVGNAIEKDPTLICELALAVHENNSVQKTNILQ